MAALHGGSALSTFVRSRVRVVARRVMALACLGLFAAPGVAFASCPAQAVSTPFSHWGDANRYFPLPGGSFEGSAGQLGSGGGASEAGAGAQSSEGQTP